MKAPLARRWALVAAGLLALALGASLVSGRGSQPLERPPPSRDSRDPPFASMGEDARTRAGSEAPAPAPAASSAKATPDGQPSADPLSLPAGRGAGGVVADAFSARGWAARAASPAASAPAAPPPPAAPASAPARLPFVFIGRLTEQGEAPLYVFERGARVVTARPGQMLDSQYRFESATAGELAVVQLPDNIRHTIRIGP